MSNNGIVNIHGKDYMTVARRVELAHEERVLESVETDVLSHEPVVIRAKVTVNGKVFTGISSVSLETDRMIEKQNPYEVAETSAVGRALGFAGYGVIESIASADEMARATTTKPSTNPLATINKSTCEVCGKDAFEKIGLSKTGKEYHAIFCTSADRSHTKWLYD